MKTFSSVVTLFAVILLAFNVHAGSVQRADLSADEVASEMETLGVCASSFDCTFDEPVYCQVTFMSRAPNDPESTSAVLETHHPAKTIRLNWCRLDGQELARSLGLTAPTIPKTRYKFTINRTTSVDVLSNAHPSKDDNQVGSGDFRFASRIDLDTEIPLFGWAKRNSDDRGNDVVDIKNITRHDRYELATVRFSTKPFTPRTQQP